MKANTLKAGLLAVVASTALLATSVYAEQQTRCQESGYHMKSDRMGHHNGGMKSDMKKMFRGLDLTDEQRTEIKSLMKAQKESMQDSRPTSDERQAHKAEMLALITADSFDESQVKLLMQQKHEKRQDKAVGMLKVQNDIYKLLTPEQQIKFKENFEKGHSRHERKGSRESSVF